VRFLALRELLGYTVDQTQIVLEIRALLIEEPFRSRLGVEFMAKQMTWRKAIEKVLKEAGVALDYKDLTDRIIDQDLRQDLGATPAASVSAHLSTAIRNEGRDCPWRKVGRGLYVWKTDAIDPIQPDPTGPTSKNTPEEDQYCVISSFGMFWRREAVEWTATPKLMGMQQLGAESVDFSRQIGIYLLYDGREVIYVGRTTERPLGRRLFEHTHDRFSGRWDRFSWFGLLPVATNGSLGEMPTSFDGMTLIPALEALLIEALEPRQNRKRGDDLAAVEYLQKVDPEIQKRLVKQTMEAALNKL